MSPDQLKREQKAVEQMSSWKGPEYRAELEATVAQQRAENPHQNTREMLQLRKINNDQTERQKLADKSDGIHRNAEGVATIPRAQELETKWQRHQSQAPENVDYKMQPEELVEFQIQLAKSQGAGAMSKSERTAAAMEAAERGDMDEYRRLRRS